MSISSLVIQKCGVIIPIRIWVALLIFLGAFISYILRVNISVAAIKLTPGENFSITLDKHCVETLKVLSESPIYFPSTKHKPLQPVMVAFLFSIYNAGYLFSILISQLFADKWGATRVIGYSTLLASILTLITPLAYYLGVFVLFSVRFLIGFLSGFVFPLLHILILQWSPVTEKNFFVLTLYGASIGMILTYPMSAYILRKMSWNWIMYISGMLAIGWSVIWLLFVTDAVENHPCITDAEIAKIQYRRDLNQIPLRARRKIPWKDIARSSPVQALFVLLWGNTWNLCFYMDYMPMLLYYVLDYDLVMASMLTGVPILGRTLFSWVCAPFARYLFVKYRMYTGRIRKFFTIFSHIIPGIIQLAMINQICKKELITVNIILFLGFNGAIVSGGLANILDLTPHFAGSVYTIMQGLLCIAGIVMPFAVALTLWDHHRAKGWEIVLTINAIMYLFGGIIFLIFGSGSVQPFDGTAERLTYLNNMSLENVTDNMRSDPLLRGASEEM
ncbi:hypothetical protein ILUMI_23628 [Ignelater luminosus]|uniref:Major facilitator superfamily (MFS) profile domain-containing protein n=1 Tax=Ignelater luminosus TaxID=2038154 RepID=A0A8K0CEZ4_IGNLU|nr:hypothetical protein ILUMI_23628 [Ignelater luminosus]